MKFDVITCFIGPQLVPDDGGESAYTLCFLSYLSSEVLFPIFNFAKTFWILIKLGETTVDTET